jgi:hypothetical protein
VRAPNAVTVQPVMDLKSVPAEQKSELQLLQPPTEPAIVEVKRNTAVPVSTQQQQLQPMTGVSVAAAPDEKTATLPSSVPEQKQSGVESAAKQKKKAAAYDPMHYSPPKRPLRTGCQCKVPQSHKHLLTECPQFRAAYSVHKLAPAGWETFGPYKQGSREQRAKIEDVSSDALKEVDLLALHGVLQSAVLKKYSYISNDLRLLGHGVLRALPQLFDPDCGECREIVAAVGCGDHCQLMKRRLGIEPPQGPCPWRCSAAKDV